jgi:uncharacterized protein YjbI with pentapeptide repeats
MSTAYHNEQSFERIIQSENPFLPGTYEECVFRNCSFQNADLWDYRFIDCRFENCDLSMSSLHRSVFNQVHFWGCKMLGISFPQAERLGFSVSFENCQLAHCSFERLKLKKSKFLRCQMQQVDFTEADLSQSDFSGSDLTDSVFEQSNLEQVDFQEAVGFNIDPERNKIKKAKFRSSMLAGLLAKYQLQIQRDVS